MTAKSILFVSLNEDLENILDESFKRAYLPFAVAPGRIPELPGPETPIQLMVLSGYSLQELYKKIPQLEQLVMNLPPRLPRLYLLQETDPSLSLVPLKGDQRFFYLRGPLSIRALRSAIDRILAMKPRPQRFPLSPEMGISARFTLRPKRLPEASFLKEILEISPTGFSFHWNTAEPLLYPGDLLEDLELRAHERAFLTSSARVKHLTPLRDDTGTHGLRVGVEFADHVIANAEFPDGRSNSFLDDPLVIRTILTDAVERKTEVLVRGESMSWELIGAMVTCDEERQELRLKIDAPNLPDEINRLDILSCQFVRDNAQLQFSSVLLEIDNTEHTLCFRFPKRLDKLWARTTLRYTFDSGTTPSLVIHSPIRPQEPVIREVINLSPNGLCFWADAQKDLLFRGMKLERIELALPNGMRVSLSAEVRYLGPRDQDPPPVRIPCGIQFQDLAATDHHLLVNYLIAKNFPQVQHATPLDEAALWAFLERGEFYTPSKRDECLGTPEEVRETQARMLHAPPSFSRKLVFKDNGMIYGTVSLQQIYQQTWLVHHLCAIRHPSEFVPKNLLLFLGEWIAKTPEIDYIKMMWRPNNTWSNKMFGRLVHRLHDGEQSVVKVYNYLHRLEGPLPPVTPAEASWRVRPLKPDEAVEIESHFINQEEYFLMKSEDLVRGATGLDKVDARYRALGLFRERRVFAAFDGPRLAGFSLAERSSAGLNLSNLLNAFQVHVCQSDEEIEPERLQGLRQALVRRTIQYYLSHGQMRAVALTEETDLSAYYALGFERIKEYISWTFDHNIANIYNLYCYYIFRLYERLEARRQARRQRFQKQG